LRNTRRGNHAAKIDGELRFCNVCPLRHYSGPDCSNSAKPAMSAPETSQIVEDNVVIEIPVNRRSKQRFSIDFPLEYKVLKNCRVTGTGIGNTVNMSSGGVAFASNDTFKVGTHVELSVSWPVLLNGFCPIKLLLEGRIVRSDQSLSAIRMDRHEFRTQGRRQRLFSDNPAAKLGLRANESAV
jgi:PilZ domain